MSEHLGQFDDSGLPERLHDDAPCQQCWKCGRKTWDCEQFERPCGMTQPDGSPCDGVFRSVPDA